MVCIEKNMIVSFRYIMKNGRQEVLENSMEGIPTIYLHGTSGIHAILQDQLFGLVAGDKKKIFLLKNSDLTNDDFTFDVVIDEIRMALPEEILLGYPVQVNAEKCEADCSCYIR